MRKILCVALLLAACGNEPDSEEAITPEPEPSQDRLDPAPIPVEPEGWTMIGIGAVAERIGYSSGTGGMAMELSCLSDPARLEVEATALTRVGSEERLVLRLGSRQVPLTAVLEDGAPVAADVPLTADLIAALEAANEITLGYGATWNDPLPAPPEDLMDSFATGCSAAMNDGAAEAQREDL
ncbi:hypothetical protein ACSMXM_02200 [Pacificimonas sp. ICDLI1SI03]